MTAIKARILSANMLRACLFAGLFMIVALAGLAPSGSAKAQTVGLSKTLCATQPTAGDPTPCAASSAPAFAAVWYKVVINNTGGPAGTIALAESYPANFQFVGVTCTATNGAGVSVSAGAGGTPISVSMPAGQIVACVVNGYFTGSGSATNSVSSGSASAQWNSTVPSPTTLPTDLSIVKTASVTQVNVSGAPASVTYTITVTNNGANAVYLGQVLTVRDSLSLFTNGVPLNVTLVGSPTCTATPGTSCMSPSGPPGSTPTTGNFTPFMTFNFPTSGSSAAGYIPVNGSFTLTYTVNIERFPLINCIRQPSSDGIQNRAELILDPPGPVSTMVDVNTTNNSSTPPGVSAETGLDVIDPYCGQWLNPAPLTVTKTQITMPQPPGGFLWPNTIGYRIKIKNNTNQVLSGIQISDFVMSIPGSPPFDVSRTTAPQLGAGCGNITTPFSNSAPQSVTAYYTPAVVGTATLTLQPNQTCEIDVFPVTYSAPKCDAFRNLNNPIRNTFRAVWTGTWTSPPNGAPSASGAFVAQDSYDVSGVLTDTRMADATPCDLRVTKTPTPGGTGRIEFGVWTSYNVSFSNNAADPVEVGTLYDALRIVQPNYAVSLTTSFQYNCPPVSGVSNAPTAGSGVTSVVYTQYPHQGARIINGGLNPGPVVFGPNSTLSCVVKVKVDQPPPGSPYCLSAVQPELENTALMNSSANFTANGPWAPYGAYDSTLPYPANQPTGLASPWRTAILPMPKCFHLVINKTASPTVTWTTSPSPITYTITVQNQADPIASTGTAISNWDGPVVKDAFTQNFPAPATFVSLSPANCCTWLTAPTTPVAGSVLAPNMLLGIRTLAAGATVTLKFQVNPGPYVQPSIINEATEFRTQAGTSWYSNDPRSCGGMVGTPFTTLPPSSYYQSAADSCSRATVQVLGVGKVKVIKTVVNATGAPTPATFAMTLDCTFNGTMTSWPMSAPPGTTGVTQSNIPETSTCSVTEPALGQVGPTPNCPVGAIWSRSYSAQPVTVLPNATKTITVTNTLTCLPPGPGLTIKKVIIHPTQGNLLMGPAPSFLVNVSCTDGYSGSLTLIDGASQTLYGPSANTSCTITETLPASPFQGNCPILMNWMAPTMTPASPVTVAPGGTTVTLTNRYQCFTPFGTLIIKKVLVLDGNLTVATPFQVQVTCNWPGNPPSYFKTVALGGSQSMQQTLNQIPLGMICKVVESPPPPLTFWQPPCRWLTTYVGSTTPTVQHQTTVTTTSQTLTILNEQTCSTVNSATEAEFKIYKEIWTNGATSNTVLSPMSFTILLTCTGRAPETIVINTTALGLSQVSRAIAAGSTCTVFEATQGPPPTAPVGCSWAGVTYRWYDGPLPGVMGSTVTLTQPGRTYGLSVRNALTCPPQMPPVPPGDGRRSTPVPPPAARPPYTPPPYVPPPAPRDDAPPMVDDGSRPVDGVMVILARADGGPMGELRTGGEGQSGSTRLPPGTYRVILDPVSLAKGLTGMPGVKMTSGRPPISIGVGLGGSSGSGGSRDDPYRKGGGGGGSSAGVSIGIPIGGSAPKLAAVPGATLIVVVTVGGQSSETRLPCCDKRGLDSVPVTLTVPQGAGPIAVSVRYAPPPKKR